MTNNPLNFFKELKRRKVYRVAVVYAITAWMIVQIAGTTFPYLNLPDWTVTAVILFVVIAFPIALVLAWAFDISPDGIVRTTPETEDNEALPARKKKPFTSTLVIVVLVTLIVAQFAYGRFFRNSDKEVLSEEVREERVAVAPFNNFTNDATLDAFGYMASEWITTALRQLDVKTSSPDLMRQCKANVGILPGNPNNAVSLYDLTGAKYVVTGSYYLEGDLIQVSSRLESTETGEIIHDFPSIKGSINIKEKIINDLSENLKGFWAVKEANLLSKLNAPKYDAYQKYLDCGLVSTQCYQDALEIDSTFILAWTGLYYSSAVWANEDLMNKANDYITGHWDECTEFEKNYFKFVEFQNENRHKEALEALNECYKLDSLDFKVLHESAYFYLCLNQPQKATERFETVFNKYEIFKEKMDGNSNFIYLIALNRSGQHEKVIAFAQANREDLDVVRDIKEEVARAMLMEGDIDLLNNWIGYCESNNLGFNDVGLACLFNEINPLNDSNIFAESLKLELPNLPTVSKSATWLATSLNDFYSKAFAYYVLKDYARAEILMTGLTESDLNDHLDSWFNNSYPGFSPVWMDGFLAAIYARQGKTELAKQQIEKLESHRPDLSGFQSRKARGSFLIIRPGSMPYWGKKRIVWPV